MFIGPATRCDTALMRWGVPKLLRCMKTACDAMRCKFEHVQYFGTDFGISQPFIILFSNGLQYCDGDLMSFHMIYEAKLSVKYF